MHGQTMNPIQRRLLNSTVLLGLFRINPFTCVEDSAFILSQAIKPKRLD